MANKGAPKKTINKKEIGLRIKEARINAGLNQNELSELLDKSPQSISNWECGISTPPTKTIKTIANICGVDFNSIYDTNKYETIKILQDSNNMLNSFNPLEEEMLEVLKSVIAEKIKDLHISVPSKEFDNFIRYVRLSFSGSLDIYINQKKEEETENE